MNELPTRLGRLHYFLISLGISFAVGGSQLTLQNLGFIGLILLLVVNLAALVMSVAVSVRRIHDLDQSAWLLLLFLVPGINFLFAVYLLLMPGTAGHNRFGPPPA